MLHKFSMRFRVDMNIRSVTHNRLKNPSNSHFGTVPKRALGSNGKPNKRFFTCGKPWRHDVIARLQVESLQYLHSTVMNNYYDYNVTMKPLLVLKRAMVWHLRSKIGSHFTKNEYFSMRSKIA